MHLSFISLLIVIALPTNAKPERATTIALTIVGTIWEVIKKRSLVSIYESDTKNEAKLIVEQ